MFFTSNSKRGSYTGFWKNIPKTGQFDNERFLAAHALPGPNSKIACEILARGKNQKVQVFICKKDHRFSQIPNYNYK